MTLRVPLFVLLHLPLLSYAGTGLYELWKTGNYRNYTPDELVDVIAQILSMVPPWTRVYRIQVGGGVCTCACLSLRRARALCPCPVVMVMMRVSDMTLTAEGYPHAAGDLWGGPRQPEGTVAPPHGGAGPSVP